MAKNSKILKPSGKKATWIWAMVLMLFIGELFFYTWCRLQCVQMRMDISTEQTRQKKLESIQSSLSIEMARLIASERITYIARNKLGLDIPEPSRIIEVPEQ